MLARNLLGICPELARNSEFARNSLGKRPRLAMRGTLQLRAQLTRQPHHKGLLEGSSLSEYGLEGFQVRLRRLSEYGSVAYFVERPTRETQAEQYSDTVLRQAGTKPYIFFLGGGNSEGQD